MHPRYQEHIRELWCVLCTCVLENWNWTSTVDNDVEQEHKDARSLKNAYWETATEYRCCAQFWPPPDYYPPSIGRFRVRCGVGVRIRQSYSDFNERGNNLAGGRKWAQHWPKVPSPWVKFLRWKRGLAINYDFCLNKLIICCITNLFVSNTVVKFRYGVGLRDQKYGHAE